MNRRDLLLTILAAADGRTFTPVQIQKAVFLVCDHFPDLIEEGPTFNFQPYDYGPFDSDVYSEIEALNRAGEAVIAPSAYGNWNTYAASDDGADRGQDLLNGMDDEACAYIQKISTWVRSLNFKSSSEIDL